MTNKLSDLNNKLFAHLERRGEEDLTVEPTDKEVKRSEGIIGVRVGLRSWHPAGNSTVR